MCIKFRNNTGEMFQIQKYIQIQMQMYNCVFKNKVYENLKF